MASDAQSINTGSPTPKPYAPQASAPENIPVAPMPAAPAPNESFQIPQADANANQPGEPAPKKSGKGIFTVLIVVIVVAGLAALGYFVVYPIFFAPAELATEDAPPTPPIEPAPENPAPTAPENEPAPASALHASLFTTPADSQFETSVITTGATLTNITLNTTVAPAISEIVYKDSTGNLMKFSDILKGAVGLDISANPILGTVFNDLTATGLIYLDSNNAKWLGFAAQLASGADAAAVSAAFKQAFESVNEHNALFSSAPGTAQAWKDGQITGVTGNRYLLFSNSGFAIDYGWVGNKLVIMASYEGFKEAVRRLQ